MRILVTGASGFVGAALVPLLQARGDRLRCLLRPGSDLSRRAAASAAEMLFERVDGDIEDVAVLAEAMRGIDAVVHLAALVSFRKQDRERSFAINDRATGQLAQLAREAGVSRFLHVSSVSAVGWSRRPVLLGRRRGLRRRSADRLRRQ